MESGRWNRRKRVIAGKVAACVGFIYSVGLVVFFGSISQLKTEDDQTRKIMMRSMYFIIFFNWIGIFSCIVKNKRVFVVASLIFCKFLWTFVRLHENETNYIMIFIITTLCVALCVILIMSNRIINRLIEKNTLESSQSVELYGESRKCVAIALNWLMIAFINGTVILFIAIIYLPESFALIAVLTIALNIAMTMAWLHKINNNNSGRTATVIWFGLLFGLWTFHLCCTQNGWTNAYRFTALIVFCVISYFGLTKSCLPFKRRNQKCTISRSPSGCKRPIQNKSQFSSKYNYWAQKSPFFMT